MIASYTAVILSSCNWNVWCRKDLRGWQLCARCWTVWRAVVAQWEGDQAKQGLWVQVVRADTQPDHPRDIPRGRWKLHLRSFQWRRRMLLYLLPGGWCTRRGGTLSLSSNWCHWPTFCPYLTDAYIVILGLANIWLASPLEITSITQRKRLLQVS